RRSRANATDDPRDEPIPVLVAFTSDTTSPLSERVRRRESSMGSVIPMKKKICKVLVVEDDSGIRELLTDVFESEGYHFVLAANAEEMRAAMVGDPDIDILIVDV